MALYPLKPKKYLIAIFITMLGLCLRLSVIAELPINADEPLYLVAAHHYASAIETRDLMSVISYTNVLEHPPLVRILYAAAWLIQGEKAWLSDALSVARIISAIFGSLSVLLVSTIDPLAGGLLAIQPITVKYTSLAYLEALPQLTSLIAVLSLRKSHSTQDFWFYFSAASLGVTAAGKYSYFPVLVPVVYLLWEGHLLLRDLILFFIITVFFFYLFNPTLWLDPFQRLLDSVSFHLQYSDSGFVQQFGYNWYQPLIWLAHPVFGYSKSERLFNILILGVLVPGIHFAWKSKNDRPYAIWFSSGLSMLLIWKTKWPQYILVITPPLCMIVSSGLRYFYDLIVKISYRFGLKNGKPVIFFSLYLFYLILCVSVYNLRIPINEEINNVSREHINADATRNTFGDSINLLGYQIIGVDDDTVTRGESFYVELYWQTTKPITHNYTIAIHLLGTEYNPITNGPLWAQDDHWPLGGAYPTTWWVVNVPFEDRATLHIPPNTPLGIYELNVAVYSFETMERLPVSGASVETERNYAHLSKVRVNP
jgi:hypothetical protein